MKRRKYICVTTAVIYAGLIFYFSSIPTPPSPLTRELFIVLYENLLNLGIEFIAYPFYFAYLYPDKFAHLLLYMGFGFTLNPAVRSFSVRYPELVSVILGTAYGVIDELHQSFIPYRSSSLADLFADFVGLILSQLVILLIKKRGK